MAGTFFGHKSPAGRVSEKNAPLDWRPGTGKVGRKNEKCPHL